MEIQDNVSKAREIARDYKRPASSLEAEIACESALEMAEWKDHQFKEYLEKKKAEYISRRDDADIWSEQWAVFHALACTLHIIIIELFKEKQNERK